jgi:hypothetical protein
MAILGRLKCTAVVLQERVTHGMGEQIYNQSFKSFKHAAETRRIEANRAAWHMEDRYRAWKEERKAKEEEKARRTGAWQARVGAPRGWCRSPSPPAHPFRLSPVVDPTTDT